MKKNQIKFIGVCAAALMTVAAVAPVTTHAEGAADASISTFAAGDVTYTDNALLQSVPVTVSEINPADGVLTASDLVSKISSLLGQEAVGQEDVNPATNYKSVFDLIFDKALVVPGTVADNIGLTIKEGSSDTPAKNIYSLKDGTVIDGEKIFVESQGFEGVNHYYKAGESFTLKFMGLTKTGQRVEISSVKVNVIADAVAPKYNAIAQNITNNIGVAYAINDGVTVTGPKGNQLTYIGSDIIDPATGAVKSGVPATDAELNAGVLTLNKGTNQEKVLKPGTWYYISDNTRSDDSGTATPFETAQINGKNYVINDIQPNGKTQLVYDQATVDGPFRQGLQVVIPSADTTKAPATSVTFNVKRTITVQNPTDVIPEPVFRAYNPNDGDHLFTTSKSEYDNVVNVGWSAENQAWVAQKNGAAGGYEVYRLYNPNSGEHFYTSSKAEYINLGNAGWKQEGVGFFSAAEKDNVAVYRAFNPNAKGPGSHMFTTSKVEYDNMVKAGWTGEKIAFYGLAD